MKKIAIIIMKIMLQKAKNSKYDQDSSIVKQAYDNMIKNYETTIMFLESQH